MRLEQLVVDAVLDYAVDKAADFAYKCKKKNAAEDQRLEDLKHIAVLGGEHD